MGMYTKLEFDCVIKQESRQFINKLCGKEEKYYWDDFAKEDGYAFLKEFSEDGRSGFIPHGYPCSHTFDINVVRTFINK